MKKIFWACCLSSVLLLCSCGDGAASQQLQTTVVSAAETQAPTGESTAISGTTNAVSTTATEAAGSSTRAPASIPKTGTVQTTTRPQSGTTGDVTATQAFTDPPGEDPDDYKQGKKLVWSDEFNGTALNRENWMYEEGFLRNGEPQCYTSRTKNVRVENGCLVLEGHHENYTYGGKTTNLTSGSVKTTGKKAFQYGVIEARLKLPRGSGTWPAFWTLGDDVTHQWNWPLCGEIDILEWYGANPYAGTSAVHWQNFDGQHVKRTLNSIGLPGGEADMSEQWFTYGIIWDEHTIKFYRNGYIYDEIECDMDEQRGAFQQAHCIKLNLAFTPGTDTNIASAGTFPKQYLVDYVRVWQ